VTSVVITANSSWPDLCSTYRLCYSCRSRMCVNSATCCIRHSTRHHLQTCPVKSVDPDLRSSWVKFSSVIASPTGRFVWMQWIVFVFVFHFKTSNQTSVYLCSRKSYFISHSPSETIRFSPRIFLMAKRTALSTRWFKYDREWFVCKQAALHISCATLREW